MRKLNKIKQLGRTASHRNAMFLNMATSFIKHERIISTKAKIKVLQKFTERLITRAKKVNNSSKPEEKLHHKREIFKVVKDRDMALKLYDDIAQRYENRSGGYTRIFLLPNRKSDASKMAMIELVELREKQKLTKSSEKNQAKKEEQDKKAKKPKKEKIKKS